jgi:2-polyprenyl-3-methyl-5-hydroxy-6-metoxy-1,4-benzoquinol methylase
VNAPAQREIAARIAARYKWPSHRSYIRGKLRWDPLFAAIVPLLVDSPRALLDIGCGLGLLGQYLRERGAHAPYRGLDLDARKIEEAREASRRADFDLAFEHASAEALPEFSGDVTLFDVLHYLPSDAQHRVLAAAAARIADGGVLLIRNVLREDSWRFRVTVAEERIARLLGWMRTPPSHFPLREEIEDPLRAMGFAVQTEPLWGRTPFNSYLITARREVGATRRLR